MGAKPFDAILSKAASRLLNGDKRKALLEAGCGSACYFDFGEISRSVGIDIDRSQLDKNTALEEKILGDLQTYPLPSNAFDVVVCWDVIEHLSRPRDALRNMFQSIKPGGVMILGFPNLLSIKGIVTKLTPFWVHEALYRHLNYESRHFPTYLRCAILPDRVSQLASELGLDVAYFQLVEGGVTQRMRTRYRLLNAAFWLTDFAWHVVTLGRGRSLLLDSCGFMFRKPRSDDRCEHRAVHPNAEDCGDCRFWICVKCVLSQSRRSAQV